MEKERKPIKVNHIFKSEGLTPEEIATRQSEFDQDFLRYLARLQRDKRINGKVGHAASDKSVVGHSLARMQC